MQVSIVIPALNEEQSIVRAVSTARATGADEVIVVDGGSTDKTVELARQQGCRLLKSRTGRAVQMNSGARIARGQVLLFQHADNWFDSKAVQQIREAMASSSVSAGAFRQRIDSPRHAYRVLEWGNACRARRLRLPYGDQGIFVRRGIFEAAGGFPDVPFLEDYLLMKTLRRHARVVLLPGPIHVDARRWERHGILAQTLRNWSLVAAYQLGVAPDRLARWYER